MSSQSNRKLIVFSDLDGTLLDHDSYRWDDAMNALQLLEKQNIPVIFNTSKTLREVREIQETTGIRHPFISENGMVTSIPAGYFPDIEKDTHLVHGLPYKGIRRLLNKLRLEYGFEFTGFGDCDKSTVAELTGLLPFEAAYACDRKASEPLIWRDSDAALVQFKYLLQKEGLNLTRGGRFYHVSGNGNKGMAARKLLERFRACDPDYSWVSIGLGDGLNDLPMLEVVDYPVLVRAEHHSVPDTSHLSSIFYTTGTGPRGWNEAITRLLTN
ncbi:hypothetical protein GZ77_23345 [Endozoicomonas montiporae]|uniref:Mannosyl-3-phosphoglycerate phosphatase n=2 Tax=Endozoicomonas montiporae TaxID=1027273 RepID=A0A081N0Q4_9GAMM|nr:HAD-IIB family hydrolase [Endozoicomonas montiporae]AMO54501.1 mannosyl-3-phosphoglycerate phosphatase [Endozoicomonas montiporae CL-33]KEQ12027.1 hypothetical protein GZ77_23345 [Endozoicomonas montiporae]